MNLKLSKALTGAAWVLVGLGALKQVWRVPPSSSKQNDPNGKDKRTPFPATTDTSREPTRPTSH